MGFQKPNITHYFFLFTMTVAPTASKETIFLPKFNTVLIKMLFLMTKKTLKEFQIYLTRPKNI